MADLPIGEVVEPVDVPSSLRTDTITGRFVTLRRPLASDAVPLFHSTHGDHEREAVWAYMGYGPWAGLDEFQSWLVERLDSSDPLWFTVASIETGQPLGMVTILNADLPNRRLELGHIWYIPQAQRTAANTEATYLLLSEGFDHYHARRVEWKCDSMNEKSKQAALRIGFSFEGVFRNHMIVKGRNRDTAWFSVTDRDWPGVKKSLEHRLYGT